MHTQTQGTSAFIWLLNLLEISIKSLTNHPQSSLKLGLCGYKACFATIWFWV